MQQEKGPAKFFDEEQAAAYDTRFAMLAPLKEALHLCMRSVLRDLPEEARILCVGAGTGAELLYLAQAFPRWNFILVDPSGPMLQRCRQRAEEAGILLRCDFHEGYLDSLPSTPPFDAATSLLVSQFILEDEARIEFFREIARRLKPRGRLLSADLAGDLDAVAPGSVLHGWMNLMRLNGSTEEQLANSLIAWKTHVAVRPPEAVAALIASGGFITPVLFCQTLLIHAWCARRAD